MSFFLKLFTPVIDVEMNEYLPAGPRIPTRIHVPVKVGVISGKCNSTVPSEKRLLIHKNPAVITPPSVR